MKNKYRVYNVEQTPNEGGELFFDVATQKDAKKLCKHLNITGAAGLHWVWAWNPNNLPPGLLMAAPLLTMSQWVQ